MKRQKTYTVESKVIDADAGIFEAMISTESIDRDGDILVATGAQLENFRANPVVLFAHNYREARAVVGKALSVEAIPGKGLLARFQFAGEEVSEDAALVKRLWEAGFLNATSVGFQPIEFHPRELGEDEDPEQFWYPPQVFEEWDLLEFSIVPVPANQDALRLAVKGLDLEMDRPPVVFSDDISKEIVTIIPDESVSQAETPDTEADPQEPNTDNDIQLLEALEETGKMVSKLKQLLENTNE